MQCESSDTSEMDSLLASTLSSLGLKYTGRTGTVSTYTAAPGMFQGWRSVAQEPLCMVWYCCLARLKLFKSAEPFFLIFRNRLLPSCKLQSIAMAQDLQVFHGTMQSELCTIGSLRRQLVSIISGPHGYNLLFPQYFPIQDGRCFLLKYTPTHNLDKKHFKT